MDEVEAIAGIGSYVTDFAADRWVSSPALDAIFGIDSDFERSVGGWVSLVHPADREAMVAYLDDEVLGQGHRFDREYRIVRADTGEVRVVHGRGTLEVDGRGRPIRLVGTIADITEQREAEEALRAERQRYEAIFDGATEAILIADLETRRFRWVNAAASQLLGYSPDELLELGLPDIHPAGDLPMVLQAFEDMADGRITVARSIPCLRKDGSILLADIKGSSAVLDGIPCNIGFFSDVTDRVRSEDERSRLEDRLRRSERNLAEAQRLAHIGSWEWDLATNGALRSDELHRIYGVEPGAIPEATEAFLTFVHPDDRARVQAAERAAVAGNGRYAVEYRAVRPDGSIRIIRDESQAIFGSDGAPVRMVGTVQDITDRMAADADRARLATAVDQTSDAVVITDVSGAIEYVNPAFERMSGLRRDAVLGQNPRILKSGRQSDGFYRALWRRLARGETWAGKFFNRRSDGSLYEVEATISPIRGPNDEIGGYIAVERDITSLQAARSTLANEFRERAQVAAGLARLQPAGSAEATAGEICDELIQLPGVDLAMITNFLDAEHAVPLALRGPDGLPLSQGVALPTERARYLYERASQGPWAEVWKPRVEDGTYGKIIAALGFRAMAYAPIRNGEGLLGFVAAGTRDAAYSRHLIDHLPAVGEFAATASALLSRDLEGGHRVIRVRDRIRSIIRDHEFESVFQPIVDLGSGETVGYEALTRFHDGLRPDLRFAEAWTVDLGAELELATLEAALDLAGRLPNGHWLNVNMSPRLLSVTDRIGGLLTSLDRPLVVEITEHETVTDYRVLRDSLKSLGESIRTAVDDAGAGIANFAHIIELRPDFVKLDISLVRGVNDDLGRQAIVVAMHHFAQTSGCRLIAEGVETAAEAACLLDLGVNFGQGYWYARPAAVDAFADVARSH